MRIGNVTALLSGGQSSNSYLIEDEKTCLIDPGIGKKDYGIKSGGVDIILLTHNHYDHVGNCSLFENAKIYAHEKDLNELTEGKNIYSEFYGEKLVKISAEALPEKIKLGKTILDVVHTPGHTKGSCCFFNADEKLLFSGDTVFADGIGRTDLHGGNEKELKDSIEKIAELDFRHLLPGHGPLGSFESAKYALEFVKRL